MRGPAYYGALLAFCGDHYLTTSGQLAIFWKAEQRRVKGDANVLFQMQSQEGDQEPEERDSEERKTGNTRSVSCLWNQGLSYR